MNYKAIVEGLLFVVGDEGITVDELKKILETDNETLKQTLLELKKDYETKECLTVRINSNQNVIH